ncbi:MAG TPA: hypothetical protein VN380_21260 [Thermoanaerobaculia bacterium]|jgi:hypothetical protein|nr:hypothetical protein [Thermoanaerobaculia bacterium]
MNDAFSIRNAIDRKALAAFLPMIDGRNYAVERDEFTDLLARLATCIPESVSLVYEHGGLNVARHHVTLQTMLELAVWLRALSACAGFGGACQSFGNPTQFWDTHFEMRVAFFMIQRPCVQALEFAAIHDVRGKKKRPDFTIELFDSATVVVECKRIHFPLSRVSQEFEKKGIDVNAALTAASFPNEYRLEMEFITPQRGAAPLLPAAIAHEAVTLSACGGGSIKAGNVALYVRRRADEFLVPLTQAGLQMNIVTLPMAGKAVRVGDPKHTSLRVTDARYTKALFKLITAAIADARSQLPEGVSGVVCIGDVPFAFANEIVAAHPERIVFPPNIAVVSLWDGDQLQIYFPDARESFVEQLVGDLLPS